MKSGAGSDPFADESDEDTDESESSAGEETESTADPAIEPEEHMKSTAGDSAAFDGSQSSIEQLPYIFDRDGVKDDRSMTQYFLRTETLRLEKEAQSTVSAELDTEVYLTDLREALVRVGAEHRDEVVDELRSWGYRFNK